MIFFLLVNCIKLYKLLTLNRGSQLASLPVGSVHRGLKGRGIRVNVDRAFLMGFSLLKCAVFSHHPLAVQDGIGLIKHAIPVSLGST